MNPQTVFCPNIECPARGQQDRRFMILSQAFGMTFILNSLPDEFYINVIKQVVSPIIGTKHSIMRYVVVRKADGRFYKGEITIKGKQVAQWISHVKFAKVYVKRGWAEKAAAKWNSVVEEVGR